MLSARLTWGRGGGGMPIDEMFAPGGSPEMELPLRAHPETLDGTLGVSPLGRGLTLTNLEWRRRVFRSTLVQAAVVVFLGSYLGTVHRSGFIWTWPLTERRIVSLRVKNFDSQILKVNDAVGNPVEVAAVVVWRVVDTAKAVFDVEDYDEFVKIQTETAVRHMASLYPYDSYDEGVSSLRANADAVTDSLHRELQEHLRAAGVEVLRTQLRRLAYATEIAADMLRRQQADAVVAARSRIVEGAVGMVDMALTMLSEKGIVTLDEERKAAMVSNLLVVLCGESRAQPVVNTGTLYQ